MGDERQQEIDRKRKRNRDNKNGNCHNHLLKLGNNGHGDFSNPIKDANDDENDELKLTLSLQRSTRARLHSPPPPSNGHSPPPPPPPQFFHGLQPPQSAFQLRPPVPPSSEENLSHPPRESPLQLPTSHPILAQSLYDSPPPLRTHQEYTFFSPLQEQYSSQTLLQPVNNSPPSSPPLQRPLPPPPLPKRRRNQPHASSEQLEPTADRNDPALPPYPWATSYRCTVHSLDYLLSNQIHTISGDVQCKHCDKKYEMTYNLIEKFSEISNYIARNKYTLHDRAPPNWIHPILPSCRFCEKENSAKPVMAASKKDINWLFLLLGQMIGCCTLEQLKYFCKHTRNHRTGAKDRVLFLTYLELCKQLDPTGPFERL